MLPQEYRDGTAMDRAAIQDFLHADPDYGFRCAYKFVVASIRQRFSTLGPILAEWNQFEREVEENDGDINREIDLPKSAWGMKGDALSFLVYEEPEQIASVAATFAATTEVMEAMDLALTLPGLGMVKAGFLCQLYGLPVGCIDSHNAQIFDINVSQYEVRRGMQARTRLRKINEYVDLCYDLGGSAYLWDHWCAYLSSLYEEVGTPSNVSRTHVHLVCQ